MTRRRRLVAAALGLAASALIGAGCGGKAGENKPAPTPDVAVPATDIDAAGALKLTLPGDWLAAGAGAVWISRTTEIDRIDPRSGKLAAVVPVPQGPCEATAFSFGALWTATCEKPGLARIDPPAAGCPAT